MPLRNILSRRSIRNFTDKPVSDDDIEEILKAAMAAPSARNLQPWEFIVLNDRELMDKIPEIQPYTKMILQAPIAFIVCGNSEVGEKYWVQDCSAATQNLLLAIHAKGLGAVWCGLYPNKPLVVQLQKLLNLPQHIIPLNVIPTGHPAEEEEPSNRYDEKKVHRNTW